MMENELHTDQTRGENLELANRGGVLLRVPMADTKQAPARGESPPPPRRASQTQ
jgi:hypothetical protein